MKGNKDTQGGTKGVKIAKAIGTIGNKVKEKLTFQAKSVPKFLNLPRTG